MIIPSGLSKMFNNNSCNYILFFNVLLKIISNEDLNNRDRATYKNDKIIKISNVLNVLLSMYKPAWVRSLTPISEIIPVVKNIKINWLDNEGNILIRVCGRTIFLKIVILLKFKELAASIWFFGVELYPDLKISPKYPVKFIVKANSAWAQNGHTYSNKRGNPKVTKNNWTINGVFRMKSIQQIEKKFKGITFQYIEAAKKKAIIKPNKPETTVKLELIKMPSKSKFKYSDDL